MTSLRSFPRANPRHRIHLEDLVSSLRPIFDLLLLVYCKICFTSTSYVPCGRYHSWNESIHLDSMGCPPRGSPTGSRDSVIVSINVGASLVVSLQAIVRVAWMNAAGLSLLACIHPGLNASMTCTSMQQSKQSAQLSKHVEMEA